jgi:hypothetical protein
LRIYGLHGLWWQSGSRPGETRWYSIENETWDHFLNFVVLLVPQPKVVKTKVVLWVAGRTWEYCVFTAHGDFMTMRRIGLPDEDGARWIWPELHDVRDAGQRIQTWLTDLLPRRSRTYNDVAIPELPDAVTGGSFRHGVVQVLGAQMPMEFVIHITGHDLRTLSALFNYLRPYIALQTAGGLVLAGWPAPPYGRLSNGPIPASLGPILNLGVAMDRLKAMINCLFQFDTTTPSISSAGTWSP